MVQIPSHKFRLEFTKEIRYLQVCPHKYIMKTRVKKKHYKCCVDSFFEWIESDYYGA